MLFAPRRQFTPRTLLFALLALGATAEPARALTSLPVVKHYSRALEPRIWKQTRKSRLPLELVDRVLVEDPSHAFRGPYPEVFLQNERVVVCHVDCERAQPLIPLSDGRGGLVVPATLDRARRFHADGSDANVRQATVYYWVNELFDRLDRLGYRPRHRLIVRVDRDVPDPGTGLRSTNNAFFNDQDWSLSFLPPDSGFMTRLATGTRPRASAYDPGVAMHEAMHSVFDELIGPILNPEVFGLHEAFADYFALVGLDDPRLGAVMMAGQVLRDAAKPARYEPGMPEHDLGSVVAHALWRARARFADAELADRVALETIRALGGDLYASAGSVIAAHLEMVQRLGADALELNPGLLTELRAIWTETGLPDSPVRPDLAALEAPVRDDRFVTTSFRRWIPPKLAAEYGLDSLENRTFSMIERRPGPKDSGTTWYLLAAADVAPERVTPIWVLYSDRTQHIHGAYDLGRQLITLGDSTGAGDSLRALLALGPELPSLLDWHDRFGADVYQLYRNRGMRRLIVRGEDRSQRATYARINDRLIKARVYSVRLERTLLNRLVSWLGGREIMAGLGAEREVRLITVPAASLAERQLPEVIPGEKIVAYEVTLRTGVRVTTTLEGIAEVLGPPADSTEPVPADALIY